MKRKKTSLKNALNNQPALPEVKGLSSEINLDGLEEYLTEKSPKRQEVTEPQKVENLKPNQISYERAGLKVVEPKDISEIVELLKQGHRMIDISKKYNIKYPTLNNIKIRYITRQSCQ